MCEVQISNLAGSNVVVSLDAVSCVVSPGNVTVLAFSNVGGVFVGEFNQASILIDSGANVVLSRGVNDGVAFWQGSGFGAVLAFGCLYLMVFKGVGRRIVSPYSAD